MQNTNIVGDQPKGPKQKSSRSTTRKKRASERVNIFWSFSFALVIFNLSIIVIMGMIKTNIDKDFNSRIEVNKAITQKSAIINDTNVVIENYVYTLNSMYLQKYLHQFQSNLDIGSILGALQDEKGFANRLDEIETTNHALRTEETHVLKLFFVAYHIPTDVIINTINEYQLSDAEIQMKDSEKFQLSKDLLFSTKRLEMVGSLQKSLALLGTQSDEKWQEKIESEQGKFTILLRLLFFTNALLFLLIGSILWGLYIHKLS